MALIDKNQKVDVVLIGAGIIGVCCALQLAERGLSVIVVDKQPPCEGASSGNAGVISPWSCVPQSIPGLWRKIPRWVLDPEGPIFIRKRYIASFMPWAFRFLAAGKIDKVDQIGDAMMQLSSNSPSNYRRLLRGTSAKNLIANSLYIFVYQDANKANLDHFGWKMRRNRSVPISLIDRAQLQKLEPNISKAYEAAILIHDQARALNPMAIGKAIADKASKLGVQFVQNEIKSLIKDHDGWTTLCVDGIKYSSHKTVLAAGVWSASLLRPFGYNLPMEAERGYHLRCENPGITINNSIMDVEHMCVASQMDNGIRVAGTAEFAGIEAPPDYRRALKFKRILKNLFPDINTEQATPWMGRRPTLPDSLPCIGPVRNLENLFCAFGHSHYGLSQAPVTGQIIADCLTDRDPNFDISPYSIDRFQ